MEYFTCIDAHLRESHSSLPFYADIIWFKIVTVNWLMNGLQLYLRSNLRGKHVGLRMDRE